MTQTVREMLQAKATEVHVVTPDTTILAALEVMARRDISSVLIVEGDRLVGIFTERDYARKVVLQGRTSKDSRIGEVMTQNLLTISPAQSVDDVMSIMTTNRVRHLPVVERGKLLGIITIGDAVKSVIDTQQQTIRQLSGYIAGEITTP